MAEHIALHDYPSSRMLGQGRNPSPEVRMRAAESLRRVSRRLSSIAHASVERCRRARPRERCRVAWRNWESESPEETPPGDERRVSARQKLCGVRIRPAGIRIDRSLLQAAARTERSDHALVGIYEGLWRLSDAEVVHDALRLLNAPDYRVRCAIVNTLVFVFRTSRTKTVVTSALRTRLRTDKARAVRLTIERALKEIGAGR
jgi:hypothetical protein